MKIAGVRQLRARSADLLSGGEPVLVTRHGHVSGVYLPLDENSLRSWAVIFPGSSRPRA